MKVLIVLSIVMYAAVTVNGEPPKYRGAYAAPAPAPATEAPAAPYPPSGWKPSGRQFSLPARQAPRDAYKAPPKEKYGPPTTPPPPPPAEYGPPATTPQAPPAEYGPPATTPQTPPAEYGPPSTEQPMTTEQPTTTEETTEPMTTEQPQQGDISGDGSDVNAARAQQLGEPEQQKNGVYYVLLPDGRLQRVAYTTSRSQQAFQQLNAAPAPINPGYLAIQYQDVQPIQGPIYTYGTSPFARFYN